MSEKAVKVNVSLNASGNLSQFAKAGAMDMGALGKASDTVFQKVQANQKLISGMTKAGMSQGGFRPSPITMADFMGPAKSTPTGFSMSDFDKATPKSDFDKVTPKGPSTGQMVMGELKTFADGLGKATMAIGSMQAAAVGFVAAASPAAFQTFTGSLQLAAGELGIIFIPAIVKVSQFFQDVAGTIQRFDAATGGLTGQFIGAIAVPATIIAMGGAAVGTTRWLYGLGESAAGAAARLNTIQPSVPGGGKTAGGSMPFGFTPLTAGVTVVVMALAKAIPSMIKQGNLIKQGEWKEAGRESVNMMFGEAGTRLYDWMHGTKGGDKSAASLSLNFTPGSMNFEDAHDVIQRDALKDPMHQAQADQEARAIESLAREVGILSQTLSHNQPWQAGN